MKKSYLFLYTLAHACIDGLCAITLFQTLPYNYPNFLFLFILFYNILAFATQPIIGFILDDTSRKKEFILISFLLLATGFLLPCCQYLRLLLVGIANAFFHVAAGAEVLEQSNDKMYPLGIFVSTGAIGLMLGTLYPDNILLKTSFLILLIFLLFYIWALPTLKSIHRNIKKTIKLPLWVPVALLFCISIRSFMGFARYAPFEGIIWLPLFFAIFVFAGKALGGILCDYFTIRRIILFSSPLAAFFYFLGPLNYWIWALGQLFINFSMPITLYLLYKAMPNKPAFSFGLAASFLLPGWFAAFFLHDLPNWIFIIIFMTNFVLLWMADQKIQPNR